MEQVMNVIEVRVKVSLNVATFIFSLIRHLVKRKFGLQKPLLQAQINKDGAQ